MQILKPHDKPLVYCAYDDMGNCKGLVVAVSEIRVTVATHVASWIAQGFNVQLITLEESRTSSYLRRDFEGPEQFVDSTVVLVSEKNGETAIEGDTQLLEKYEIDDW